MLDDGGKSWGAVFNGIVSDIDTELFSKNRGLRKLASRALVNMNAAADSEITLYTVPTGKEAAVTHVLLRTLSASAKSAMGTFGLRGGNCNEFISDVIFSDLDATDKCGIVQKPISDLAGVARVVGQQLFVAADEFAYEVTTPQGAACTCTMDVFGYEWDA